MRIFTLLFVFVSTTVFSQIPNVGFENWTIQNGTEQPVGWKTNNAPSNISVSKTTDSNTGNFALQVVNNAPSIEGPLPGEATVYAITNSFVSNVIFDSKCDSIVGNGKGWIMIAGYANGATACTGSWDTAVVMQQYSQISVPMNPPSFCDSIYIWIIGYSANSPTGAPMGSVRLKVDEIHINSATTAISETTLSNRLNFYPNPTSEFINIAQSESVVHEVNIYDLNGKKVLENKSGKHIQIIDVRSLRNSLYIIETIDNRGSVQRSKFIVKR